MSPIFMHAAAGANSIRARRPRRHRHAQRHFWQCRGRHDGCRHHDLDVRLREWPDSGRRARLLRHGPRRARSFGPIGRLNEHRVPAKGLVLQGLWAALLVLARTRLVDPATGAVTYGNLYSDLLDYVVFAALIFLRADDLGHFCAAAKAAGRRAAVPRLRLSRDPGVVYDVAVAIMLVLILYKTQTTWPGLLIVLLGVPVYVIWSRQ